MGQISAHDGNNRNHHGHNRGHQHPLPRGPIGIVLKRSTDGGRTWRPAHTVDGLPAAYSDLVRADGATVGLLYETGDFGPYETITFRRIPVTALT